MDFAHTGTAVTTTITGLTADTAYQVRVRTLNGETDSDWSEASDAVKTNAETAAPTCTLNEGDLWCGVVTVANVTIGTLSHVGSYEGSGGMLSDNDFELTDEDSNTRSFTIKGITVDSSRDLYVWFDSSPSNAKRAALDTTEIHVDNVDVARAFSEDDLLPIGSAYRWAGTNLSWTVGDTVTLRLRPVPPVISIGDAAVTEGQPAGFAVTLSKPSAEPVTVTYVTTEGPPYTATPGEDFAAVVGRPTLTFGANETTKTITVTTIDDALDEDAETFAVRMVSPTNATLEGGTFETGTGTITDNDPTPTVTVADAAATEGDKVEFVVTLSAVSGRDVEVGYATSVATGDTAVSGTDFTAATGTLTILAADGTDTGTVEVQTTEDDASESAETFTLTLSATKNVALGTPSTATGTINNRAAGLDAPVDFKAEVGNAQVTLSWDTPPTGVIRHEFRFKTGTDDYDDDGWMPIEDSGVSGTNQKGFTVTGLTNEVEYTFQLRAVYTDGPSIAVESDAVTPTPGICDRTEKIREVILDELADVTECAAVTVADLESIATFGTSLGLATSQQGITALKAGDFAGLTSLTLLNLELNMLTALPAGIFSGLAAIKEINLNGNELTGLPAAAFAGLTTLEFVDLSANELAAIPGGAFDRLARLVNLQLGANKLTRIGLPAGVFSDLTALEELWLNHNDLTSLDAGVFNGLTALNDLRLHDNDLASLPGGLFDGLTALTSLDLENNDLTSTSVPGGLFSRLTALEVLKLRNNDLDSLPDGLLFGLTKLRALTLGDNPATGGTLALTVTLEKFGTDQVRAKVLAGAPLDVAFTPTLANGSLPASDTTLAVAAGSVDGTAVAVTRTSGTTGAVTVDIDLTTQPTLSSGFTGFEFAKADLGPAGGDPAGHGQRRDAHRAGGERRQRGPDAHPGLLAGDVRLRGVGGPHGREGDGDAGEVDYGGGAGVSGRRRHDDRRRGHGGGPPGVAGPGREHDQGEGDGDQHDRHPDLHADGAPRAAGHLRPHGADPHGDPGRDRGGHRLRRRDRDAPGGDHDVWGEFGLRHDPSKGITALKPGDFAGLTSLTLLNLNDNSDHGAARGDLLRPDRGDPISPWKPTGSRHCPRGRTFRTRRI